MDPKVLQEKTHAKLLLFKQAYDNLEAERTAKLEQLDLVEKKKKDRENEIEQERMRRLKLIEESQAADEKRQAEAAKLRQQEIFELEKKDLDRRETQKLREKLESQFRSKNIKIDNIDFASMNKEQLQALENQQLEKEKKELSEKTRQIFKRLDHVERAYRKEERKLLIQDSEKQRLADKENYAIRRKALIEASKLKHKENMAIKARVARMLPYHREYQQKLDQEKEELRQQLQAEADEKLEAAKKARIQEYLQKKEEEKKRAKELEEKALRDAELARKAAEERQKRMLEREQGQQYSD
jgi:translation initiation factor 3 subunit A